MCWFRDAKKKAAALTLSGHLQAGTFSNNLKDAQTLPGYMAGAPLRNWDSGDVFRLQSMLLSRSITVIYVLNGPRT